MKRLRNKWGLILGASSGIGLATAKKLAGEGMNLILVHRDRRGAMPMIDKDFEEVRAHGIQLITFNRDALDLVSRGVILQEIKEKLNGSAISLLLHSIAFGNLKPASPSAASASSPALDEEDLSQTIYNMGSSLLFWVQDLHRQSLFAEDSRVLGLTSEGNQIAWDGYAAISAAKGALEALARSIAKEFASLGTRCNIIQAGLTDTRALRLIPGHETLMSRAQERNPMRRLTRPEDVANAIFLLSLEEAAWINGAILRVDGGEAISQ